MAEKTITINPEFFSDAATTQGRSKNRSLNKEVEQASSAQKRSSQPHQKGSIPTEQSEKANQLRKRLLNSISAARRKAPSSRSLNSTVGTFKEANAFFNKASSNRRNNFKHRTRRNLPSTASKIVISVPNDTDSALNSQAAGVSLQSLAQPIESSITQLEPPLPKIGIEPEWGCLKQGKKPTYRKWRTMRAGKPNVLVQPLKLPDSVQLPPTPNAVVHIDPIKQRQEKLANARSKARTLAKRTTKIPPRRRTRKIGRHNNSLHVAVESRLERDKRQVEEARIKSASMSEIDKYLIKKGLIKYGNSAPDTIKRQMFEDGSSAGGAVVVNPEQAVENILKM